MSAPPISPAAVGLRVQLVSEAEAGLLAAVDAVVTPETPDPPARVEQAPLDPVKQAVAQARAEASGRQQSAAPLFANLVQVLRTGDLPAPLRTVVAQVLALRLPAEGPHTADSLRQAVAQSGLFFEAHLLRGGPLAPDLKAALLTLLRVLPPTPARQAVQQKPTTTPPPLREAALVGQPAVEHTLPRGADTTAIAGLLRDGAEQAVARQTLHQLASTPDGPAPAWLFEIPIATPQGASVAQFEIERDARAPGGDPAADTWRARFSLDVEPLGPVHVHLNLHPERAAVTVWAEREGSLERLRAHGEALGRDLGADVVFHPGAPQRPKPAAGRFVDKVS